MRYRINSISTFFLVPILLLTSLLPLNLAAQWTWQNPLPQGNPLFASYFLNADTGFIAGCEGSLLKTTDAGTNWISINTGTEYNIKAISFANASLGLFAGTNGTIGRTTDGGLSWQIINSPATTTLNSISFKTSNDCYIVGDGGTIMQSTDGGLNWNLFGLGTKNLYSIRFPQGKDAFIFGEGGTFYKCWDGWNLWMNWQINTTLNLYDAYFFDDSTGFAVGGGFNMGFNDIVLKTTNGGETWTEIFTPSETSLYSVYFFNADIGIACGQFQNIMKTTDGGQSWSYTLEYSFENYYQIAGTPDGHAFIVGGAGSILKTSNYGQIWKELSTINTNMNVWPEPRLLKSGFFHDADSGFIVGDKGGLYTTSDGGNSWSVRCIDTFAVLNNIQFLQQNTGFITSEDGFFKSIDGGFTWSKQIIDTNASNNSMHFADNNQGMVVGKTAAGSGFIAQTNNSGSSWTSSSFNLPVSGQFIELLAVKLPSATTAYIGGHCFVGSTEQGFIYKTTNSGSSWFNVYTLNNGALTSLDFVSEDEGFACGTNGLIIHTTDGGVSWTTLSSTVSTNLNSIHALNAHLIYACGDNGLILKSEDGGTTWTKQFQACSNLSGMFILNQNIAWAFGQMETILKTGNGGSNSISTIQDYDNDFYCFPNPYQSCIKIIYSINRNSVADISIFDFSGVHIETILHTNRIKGRYSIEYNNPSLRPGIYLVRLITENKTNTFKLIKY